MTAPVDRPAIEALLPHAGAMCMLSRLTAVGAIEIRCSADNRADPDHPLRHNGRLPIIAGIEYGAQAAALHSALSAPSPEVDAGTGGPPRRGYLAVLREVRWYTDWLDEEPLPLDIEAERLTMLPMGLHYRFGVRSGARLLIEGEMIIALLPQPSA